MALIQKNGGAVNLNASIVTSLPGATTAGNTILIFVQGTGVMSTPSGFTSRSPQVNQSAVYLFEKLVATGNASDTPTMTMAGAYTATWQIVEYSNLTAYDTSSGSNSASPNANVVLATPSITPASGNKWLVAVVAGTSGGPKTWQSGDPQAWTNLFTGQQSNSTPGASSPANQNALASGFADLLVTAAGASYSTGAMVSNIESHHFPASIIASYATSEVPTATGPRYRNQTNTTYASRTNTVITAPTIVNDDILILTLAVSASGTPPTPTLPAGFTLIDSTTAIGGATQVAFRVAWKRAASESGSYTVTHASATTQASITVYADCIATGSPVDVYSKAFLTDTTSSGATATATSITTTVALTKLLFLSHNWIVNDIRIPPTGFVELYEGLIYTADKTQAAAGASGTVSHATGNSAAQPWSAFLVALKGTSAIRGAKVWSGSAWVEKPVKVWSGSAWVTKPVKIWNGSAWV
jgi:hypothetical protein